MEVQWTLRTSARWVLRPINNNHYQMVALYDGKVYRISFTEEPDGWRAFEYCIDDDVYECDVLMPHEYFTAAYQSALIYPRMEQSICRDK
jgi:hypothetical protein